MNGPPVVWQIVLAVLPGALAGLFAAPTRSLEHVSGLGWRPWCSRPGRRPPARRGGRGPAQVREPAPLLRLACETVATVLATLVADPAGQPMWLAALVRGRSCCVSYVLIGVGPRTIGRQHPYAIGLLLAAPCARWPRYWGPRDPAADRGRQRDHPRPGLPGRPVLPPRWSCARSWTWPAPAAWSLRTSGR